MRARKDFAIASTMPLAESSSQVCAMRSPADSSLRGMQISIRCFGELLGSLGIIGLGERDKEAGSAPNGAEPRRLNERNI
jgi:hypothetical protein